MDSLVIAIPKTKMTDELHEELDNKMFASYPEVKNYLVSKNLKHECSVCNIDELVEELNEGDHSPTTHTYLIVGLWD